jgi:flagellin
MGEFMGIVVNTNIPSVAASRALYETRKDLETAMERLSSGKRINGAKDDAAGLTVVSRMKAQIASLNQAVRNANDGISLAQTYDGAADEIDGILVRLRELATQSANGTYLDADRTNLAQEFDALVSEVSRIATKTNWNGTFKLLDSTNSAVSVMAGFATGETISIALDNLNTTNIGSSGTSLASAAIDTATNASAALAVVDDAIADVMSARAKIGAITNRLEHTASNLMNVVQRTEEAKSRILDADFASESAALAKANVLAQAGTAMLAQANQTPQYILTLLRG